MIRVLIVDDQPVVRAGISRILGPEDGFLVVGECDDGSEVANALGAQSVDLVLMDIRMPRLDGISATRQLGERPGGGPRVLVLTTFDDDDVVWGALEAGAAGFVTKDLSAEELITAARAVAGGAVWLDPKVTSRVMAAWRSGAAGRPGHVGSAVQLTPRENEVLRRMARGATNAQIAAAMFLSEGTVKSHIGAIFAKLQVSDRAAAIVYAYDHRLVLPGPQDHRRGPRG